MPDQLESALVITLRNTIKWESAVQNDLPTIDPASRFDPTAYQLRDRVLAFRDLLVGAAIVEASVEVSNVYNYSTIKPNMQGPVPNTYSFSGTLAGNLNSQVRHVGQTSIPWDAARYADADLYGRDALIYETLSRQAALSLENSPVPSIDPGSIPVTSLWSLAEGTAKFNDINAALPMDRDAFKVPDQNLADRDNQLAAYASRLVKILQNPFEHAQRIYVKVFTGNDVEREPDVYALISDDGVERIFQSEPALGSANSIIYRVPDKTLQWIRENVDDVHPPQIYALLIRGIEPGQFLHTLAQVPDAKDAQYWRGKAGQVAPMGSSKVDEICFSTTGTTAFSGGYSQSACSSLTVPGDLLISWPAIATGPKQFNVLVKPNPVVEIAGQANSSRITGIDGGVSFPVNVASGFIGTQTYIVEGGDGIVYNGGTYLPGSILQGVDGITTYAQAGSIDSTIRQLTMDWQLALPPGSWKVQFDYADTTGTSSGFGIRVRSTTDAGAIDIATDMVPMPVAGANVLVTSPDNIFNVTNSQPFTLRFIWSYGTGQLHIRRITFTCLDRNTAQYALTATFQGTTTRAEFTGQAYQTEIIPFPATASSAAPSEFKLSAGTYSDLPLQILQIDNQSTGTYQATPLGENFQGWRQECTDRAERAIQQGYGVALAAFTSAGSTIPSFRDSGSYWSADATERWMSFVEFSNPRLRDMPSVTGIATGRQYEAQETVTYAGTTYAAGEKFYGVDGTTTYTGNANQVGALTKSKPGHIGQSCLIPTGLYIDQSGTWAAKAYWDTPYSLPTFVTCQPWMIEYGFYVVQPEFWMPDSL